MNRSLNIFIKLCKNNALSKKTNNFLTISQISYARQIKKSLYGLNCKYYVEREKHKDDTKKQDNFNKEIDEKEKKNTKPKSTKDETFIEDNKNKHKNQNNNK